LTSVGTISDSDSPGVEIPLTYQKHGAVQQNDNLLTSVDVSFYFTLNVASSTLDLTIGGETVFTQAAYENWLFDGNGDIGNAASNYKLTPTGAGVTTEHNAWQKGQGPIDIPSRNNIVENANGTFN
jgi:hypothetical protein